MKFEKTEESLESIENALAQADSLLPPFQDKVFMKTVTSMGRILSSSPKTSTTVDNVIYDSRLVNELPIEEQKRREAAAKGKPYRVPEWWRGEQANYKIAKTMMKTLPKKIGPLNETK